MRRIGLAIGFLGFCLAWGLASYAMAQSRCGDKHTQMLYTVTLVASGSATGSGTVIYSARSIFGSAVGNPEVGQEWETYILTNFHVVRNSVQVSEEWDSLKKKNVKKERRTAVTVNWFDYNNCSRNIGTRGQAATIVAYDKTIDLALLKLRNTETGVLPVAHLLPKNSTAYLADEVWAVGAGLGQPPFMTRGNISFQDKQIDGYRYLLASAPIIFGNSGGALFRYSPQRTRYELIGVPSRASAAGWSIISHMAWSIPMETVRTFLKDNRFGFIVGEIDEPAKEEDEE